MINNFKKNIVDVRNKIKSFELTNINNYVNKINTIGINNYAIYSFIFILFFISNDIFNTLSYYYIVLYPGYLTMNLIVCNKFSTEDYYIENREEDSNIIIDRELTYNKINKYNHILSYWLIFSFLFFMEHFIFLFKLIIPLYPLFKIIFIIWYLCEGNYERKNNIFADFIITPIYQYIDNIHYEIKKSN